MGIDVQFLCGAGLEQTREFLRGVGTDDAMEALAYIAKCVTTGDFANFTVERELEAVRDNYRIDAPGTSPPATSS